jgi:hypothetical protein
MQAWRAIRSRGPVEPGPGAPRPHASSGPRPARRLTPRAGRLGADLLTASRVPVAAALFTGRPTVVAAVLLVCWAWTSDVLDEALARWAGVRGRLAAQDHVVDAGVGLAIVWYLGGVGTLPPGPSRAGALILVATWAVTRVFAVQMLLQTVAYGAFLWWVITTTPPWWWLPPATVAGVLAISWRRFASELVPEFLHGIGSMLRGRMGGGGVGGSRRHPGPER